VEASIWFTAAALTGLACTAGSLFVALVGWRRGLADVAVAGAALFTMSALMARHGLSGTSWQWTDWMGTARPDGTAGLLASPAAALVALPLLAGGRIGVRLRRRWRHWTATAVLATVAAIVLVLGESGPPSTSGALVATTLGAAGFAALIRRQVLLASVSRRRSGIVAVVGLTVLTASALAGPWVDPGSRAAWVLVALDNLGLLAAAAAILYGYRTRRNVTEVLAPLIDHDPLSALDVGLAPEVNAFVSALEHKDPVTRDHVVRTAELALLAALEAGLSARAARDVALGAMLHDIGKLLMPSEIIGKPSALTDAEYTVIRTHPEQGERLLEAAPSLASAARYVRWHHERHDGRGYPDGLAHPDLPFEVALVSAADAWDAMTNTRQYRAAMDPARAAEVLRLGAGHQWHPRAVECVVRAAALQDLRRHRRHAAATVTGPSAPGTADTHAARPGDLDCICDHQLVAAESS
jgi:HD-GYP domain-containing protein (c-di-GMP phosphodiesterase class II)